MKQLIKRTALIALSVLALFVTAAYPVEGKKEPQKKIDLAKTLKFIQGWSSREKWDSFPESPSFAYYNSYSMLALGGQISPDLKKKIVEYLKSCQISDGGFVAQPKYAKDSETISTYFALKTLELLGSLDTIDKNQAVKYVVSLTQSDGSIKAKTKDKEATLSTTYYGVSSLAILNALDKLDKNKTISYINTYHEAGQGFCIIQSKISMPISTFMAVRSLSLLGGMTPGIKADVIKYLKQTRYSGLVTKGKYTAQPQIEELYYVLAAFSDLSAMNVAGKSKIYKFIESLYISENGGFGPEPLLGTTPPSTYYAIASLVKIGKLKEPQGIK